MATVARKRGVLIGFLSFIMTMGLVALAAKSATPGPERTAKDLYQAKCSVCHGADGAGQTTMGKKAKVKDVRNVLKTMSEDQMVDIVKKGKGAGMPGYEKQFTPDQVRDVVKYYRSLASPPAK